MGFDICCGVRLLLTRLTRAEVARGRGRWPTRCPRDAGRRGQQGRRALGGGELDGCCAAARAGRSGAATASAADLERIEERGVHARRASRQHVSERARKRQREQVGTLGSGNHYLEVQEVEEVWTPRRPRPSGCGRAACRS